MSAATILLAAPVSAEEPVERYRAVTQVAVHSCVRNADPREIVVCGRRAADRWRVPFVGYDAGDPRGEGVSTERNRLAKDDRLPCGQGAVIANCGGGVGIGISTGFDGSNMRVRTPAD